MGSTPRSHRFQLPLATRSTDIQMLGQCPGRWVLQCFYEEEQKPASFFELGSALHEAIEQAILLDWDEHEARLYLEVRLDRWVRRLGRDPVLESSKRGADTIHDDARRMISNWFKFVHPDSEDRLEIYYEYEWPPKVEVEFMRDVGTDYPVWGSVDAVFRHLEVPDLVAVVDWKSSASKQKNGDQLHFYTYGLGLDPEWSMSWYHNLDRTRRHAVIQEADPYPGDDVIRQRILATEAIKEGILDDHRVKFNPDWYCNYCPVQHVCPQEGEDKKRNLDNLERMLGYARPLVDIESEAA